MRLFGILLFVQLLGSGSRPRWGHVGGSGDAESTGPLPTAHVCLGAIFRDPNDGSVVLVIGELHGELPTVCVTQDLHGRGRESGTPSDCTHHAASTRSDYALSTQVEHIIILHGEYGVVDRAEIGGSNGPKWSKRVQK